MESSALNGQGRADKRVLFLVWKNNGGYNNPRFLNNNPQPCLLYRIC